MATRIEDDAASLDNFEGDDASGVTYVTPNFLHDARDIMRKFPRDLHAGVAPTEARAFRETFGTNLHIVETVWRLMAQEGILPDKGQPKHLLWALHFMKVYPKTAPGCAAVGASGGAVDAKTHRKWVWAFIGAIAELVDVVVSIFFNILTA